VEEGARELKCPGIAGSGQSVNDRTPWITQPQQRSSLVKSFTGGIITSRANQLDTLKILDPEQCCMSAADDQGQEGERYCRVFQEAGKNVPFQVVDGN